MDIDGSSSRLSGWLASRAMTTGHFDQQRFAKKCLWLFLAIFVFLACFYAGTATMSIIYPLDEAILGF
jgi:hypothetical protein